MFVPICYRQFGNRNSSVGNSIKQANQRKCFPCIKNVISALNLHSIIVSKSKSYLKYKKLKNAINMQPYLNVFG